MVDVPDDRDVALAVRELADRADLFASRGERVACSYCQVMLQSDREMARLSGDVIVVVGGDSCCLRHLWIPYSYPDGSFRERVIHASGYLDRARMRAEREMGGGS